MTHWYQTGHYSPPLAATYETVSAQKGTPPNRAPYHITLNLESTWRDIRGILESLTNTFIP
jgi:hypothetical protein